MTKLLINKILGYPGQQIILINAKSLPNNLKNMEQLLAVLNPTMVMCSETRIPNNILNHKVSINGYKILRCDSLNRHTGGVAAYVKNEIDAEILTEEHIDGNWYLTVELKSCNISGIYTILYRSPSSSHAKFLGHLKMVLDRSASDVVMGDFNIDMSEQHSNKLIYSSKLKQMMDSFGFQQLVSFPTRITERSQTIIDLVFSNNNSVKCECLGQYKISDHETIGITIQRNG